MRYGRQGLSGKLSQSPGNPLVIAVHHESINDGAKRANLYHWADGGCKLEVWWNDQILNVNVRTFEATAVDGKLRLNASANVAANDFNIAPQLHGYRYCDWADWMFDIEDKVRDGVQKAIASKVNERMGNLEFSKDL